MREVIPLEISKKLVAFLLTTTMLSGMFTLTAWADEPIGYIVQTRVETVETTNGVVTGYTVNTYNSPVQSAEYLAGQGNYYCLPNYYSPNYCSPKQPATNPQGPVATPRKDLPSGACPVPDKKPSKTVIQEADDQASSMVKYAQDRGWTVTVKNLQDSDTLSRREIAVKNSGYQMTLEQVTEVLWAGGFDTKYKYDGSSWTADQIKWTLDQYRR